MYLRTIAITAGIILLISGALNWIVDPYRIFYSAEIEGVNVKKPRAQAQVYINRARGIIKNNAQMLLLGNSRIHWGLHADSLEWDGISQNVYNAAIAGSNINTAYDYLRFAKENTQLKTAIIGVDYYSFLASDEILNNSPVSSPRKIGDYDRFLTQNDVDIYLENMKRIISVDAGSDTILTLINQRSPFAQDITVNGDNPVNEYGEYVAQKGHYQLFDDYMRGVGQRLQGPWKIFNKDQNSPDFETLKRIIEYCGEHDIELVLFIHPYHAEMLHQMRALGRWEEFIDWKRKLVETSMGHKRVQLWDFSVLTPYTMEHIPEAGSKTEMNWYWEPGHYKSSLGDEMIKRIYNKDGAAPGFGQKLDQVSDIAQEPENSGYQAIFAQ